MHIMLTNDLAVNWHVVYDPDIVYHISAVDRCYYR